MYLVVHYSLFKVEIERKNKVALPCLFKYLRDHERRMLISVFLEIL